MELARQVRHVLWGLHISFGSAWDDWLFLRRFMLVERLLYLRVFIAAEPDQVLLKIVEPVVVDAEPVAAIQHLHGEGLVEFP